MPAACAKAYGYDLGMIEAIKADHGVARFRACSDLHKRDPIARETYDHEAAGLAMVVDLLEADINPQTAFERLRGLYQELAKSGAWITQQDDKLEMRLGLETLEDD